MRTPAALAAVPFVAGSAAGILLIDRVDGGFATAGAWAGLLALLAAAGALLVQDPAVGAGAAVVAFAAAGLSHGASAARRAYDPPLVGIFETLPPGEAVVVEGILREDAAPGPSGVSLLLDAREVAGNRFRGGAGGGLRLTVGGALLGGPTTEWRAGRTVRLPATLRAPSVYLNPGARDERRGLARRGIALVGSVKSAALVEVIRKGTPLQEGAAAIRAWTRTRITRHMGEGRAAGVTIAVLIGDRGGLPAADERRMQEAGTYHVIAISGGNIAILAVLVFTACRVLLLPAGGAASGTAAVLIVYGAVAAGAPSVARAVTVAVLVLSARTLGHRGPALNALCAAAVIGVATSPLAALDAGFILSFGATLGILLGVPALAGLVPGPARGRGLRLVRRLAGPPAALLAATACAELALAPVTASLFSRIAPAGLVLNFAAIPLMTVVQIGGLVQALLSGLCDPAARLGARAADLAATGLLESARLVDRAPWLVVPVRPPSWSLVTAYYLAAGGLLHPRVRRASAIVLVGVTALALGGAAPRDGLPPPSGPLRVVVLDVGQGDATLLSYRGRRHLLVDAGGLLTAAALNDPEAGGFDIGERVLAPALQALGARALDAFVLTHADPDHLGGAYGVLRRTPTAAVWDGVPVPPHPGLHGLVAFAAGRGMRWRTVQAGDVERWDDLELRVLHPPLPEWERQRVRNDDSVVLEARLGRVSIVLPGDIGLEGERAILPRLDPDRLVVLKAPHHGSATSSSMALLQALRPRAVVFSCGRANRFGHPHPAVVARYRAIGAEIFSTADDGAVFVETDGESVEVWGWRGRAQTLRGVQE